MREKYLELPMHDRICTEITVNEHDEIELVQSVPVMWTTTDTTMVLTKDEFAKLFLFVFSQAKPDAPGWWLSSEGDMIQVLKSTVNNVLYYNDYVGNYLGFSVDKLPFDRTWTKII